MRAPPAKFQFVAQNAQGRERAAFVRRAAEEMKAKGIGKSEEDVLSYALFPAVAEKFLKERDSKPDENNVRELIVEDLTGR